jgi:EmrB/QacA subfamily drug resistance transporter
MTKQQRLILIVSILASFVAFLDGSVVNVALPAISRDLGGGLAIQQWVVDAYLITLGSLIMVAGSLSDLYGRQKVLLAGLGGFLISSLLCAISPDANFLIVMRALQGIAGALLVPSSLALIMSAFSGAPQGKAIGTWTAWTGISFIVGPLVGGFLVDALSWRFIFIINVLPIALTLWLLRWVTKEDMTKERTRIDTVGAVLCSVGLAAAVFGLIEQPHYGWGSWRIWPILAAGLLLLLAFGFYEKRLSERAMLPLSLFKVRNFSVGNLATAMIYAGLSLSTFLIVIFLQQVAKYSAFSAGLSLLPVTLLMFFLSGKVGALSGRFGARWFMTAGPFVAAGGFALMLRVDSDVHYWTRLLPAVILFGCGLTLTVAPLTSAILGSIDKRRSGIASAVNNAVARIAGLVAVAAIGLAVGHRLTVGGFHRGVMVMVVLMLLGSLISALGIQNHAPVVAVSKTPIE